MVAGAARVKAILHTRQVSVGDRRTVLLRAR